MSGSVKLGLTIIGVVVVIGVVKAIFWSLWMHIWALIVPIAVISAVGCILYGVFNRKSLGGNRRILR